MNQSRSNDILVAGCAVFAVVLAVFGLVCGGCRFTGAPGLSKAIDTAAKLLRRNITITTQKSWTDHVQGIGPIAELSSAISIAVN